MDTAYSKGPLGPHTDTTYFESPVPLIALHVLERHGTGGESVLVDGFHIAQDLKDEEEHAYRVLARYKVHHHASGDPAFCVSTEFGHPTVSHHPVTGEELSQIRWNNADRVAFSDHETLPGDSGQIKDYAQWHRAAGCVSDRDVSTIAHGNSKYNDLINDPKHQYRFQLEPGTICCEL